MTFTHALATNNYGPAKWIVDASAANGTHTTIAAALTSASSGDTIFIRPGTYTENLTLKAGVNLVAYVGDESTPNVTISGKCSFSSSGTLSISNIRLQTNSDNCLAITGSAASIVNLNNCFLLSQSTNVCISFTTASTSAKINIFNCRGDISGTGAFWSSSSTGTMFLGSNYFTNSGASTTSNNNSAGTVNIANSTFNNPVNTSSTGAIAAINSDIDCGAINTAAMTLNGTGSTTLFNMYLAAGTASALSTGTGATTVLENSTVNSSNTNAMTGAGTLNYNNISFTGTSVTVNTTTTNRSGIIVAAPAAGFLGEQIRNYATGVALSNNTATTLTSISLTAGVWDVSAVASFQLTGNNTASQLAISTNNNSFTGTTSGDNNILFSYPVSTGGFVPLSIPAFRVVLTSTTTYYAVGLVLFSAGVNATDCRLSAKRVA